MKKIPPLTEERYNKLYELLVAEEQKDLESSETVLGDSYFESPIKVILEKIVLTHIKSSNVVPIYNPTCPTVCAPDLHIESVRDRGCFCGGKPHKTTYRSANEFFKMVIDVCEWHKARSYKNMSRERQRMFANSLIINANVFLR